MGPSRGPGPHHSTSVGPSCHFIRAPLASGTRWWHEEHEGPTASRFSLRRPRGPTPIRSCVAGVRYPEQRSFQGRNSLPMVSFRRTYTLPDIASSFLRQRGLPSRGAYWSQGEALAPVASPLATPLHITTLSVVFFMKRVFCSRILWVQNALSAPTG